MKKIAMIIAVLMVSASIYAGTGFSASIKAGQTNSGLEPTEWTDVESGSNYGLAVEYKFLESWGIELQYLMSSLTFNLGSYSEDLDLTSTSLFGVYYLNFGNGLYVKGKLGMTMNSGDATIEYTVGRWNHLTWLTGQYDYVDYKETLDVDETEVSGGFGIGYDFNDTFSVEGEFMLLGEDLTSVEIAGKVTI